MRLSLTNGENQEIRFIERYDMQTNTDVLVKVGNLKKYFPLETGFFGRTKGYVHAVDNLNFNIHKGECFALVGESGCGKSTTGRLLIRLLEATEGKIFFDNLDLGRQNGKELKRLRRDFQIIFQDPYASLDPSKTVSNIIEEPFKIHKVGNTLSRKKRVIELLETVGLLPECINRFPHEFSGGQRQRIGIARALALNPKFIVCDEPVSALDVSVQAQILNLLKELQNKFNLTYLFIAHNLSVVRHISSRVAVMYVGKIVEIADSDILFNSPLHPYTQALLSAIPIPDPRKTRGREQIILEGDIPSPINPPSGCRFHTRCTYAEKICTEKEPELLNYGDGSEPEHLSACHFAEKFLDAN